MIVTDNCPCKDCERRYPACHDSCEAYIQYSNDRAQIRKELAAQSRDYYAFVKRIYKQKRRKNL